MMDIATPPTATAAAAPTATVKTPDADTEIPARIQSGGGVTKQFTQPLTNGVLKRRNPLHHHHHHHAPPVVVTYRECLKNHAASMGGHAVDGCGEFMPSPTSTPTDPTSLKCAACGCHRNFHRREPDESSHLLPSPNNPPAQHVIEYQPHHRHHPPPPPRAAAGANSSSPANSPSPPPISSSYYPSAPHMLLALSAGVSAPQPETNNHLPIPTTPGSGAGAAPAATGSNANASGKKRFRTKFTQDQKEKMQEFAERVGWKMQKRDEDLIAGFCSEIGVDKGVFKVWMHNNKSTFGSKKDIITNHNNLSSGAGIDFSARNNNLENSDHHHYHHHHHHNHNDTVNNHRHNHHHHHHHHDSVSSGGNVVGTNGSSSSS